MGLRLSAAGIFLLGALGLLLHSTLLETGHIRPGMFCFYTNLSNLLVLVSSFFHFLYSSLNTLLLIAWYSVFKSLITLSIATHLLRIKSITILHPIFLYLS